MMWCVHVCGDVSSAITQKLFSGGITFLECVVPAHSLQVALFPCLRRFFCDLVKAVSSGVFPQIRQTPTSVLSLAGEFRDCIHANIIQSERASE